MAMLTTLVSNPLLAKPAAKQLPLVEVIKVVLLDQLRLNVGCLISILSNIHQKLNT